MGKIWRGVRKVSHRDGPQGAPRASQRVFVVEFGFLMLVAIVQSRFEIGSKSVSESMKRKQMYKTITRI